jgi:hypothetical protein
VRARPGYGAPDISAAVIRRGDSRAYEAKVERRGGRMFYRDDFTDPASGWPDRVSARYSREGYRLTGENIVAVNGPVFRNFRASISTTSNGAAGLVFRQSERGYYAFAAAPGFAAVRRVEPIRTTELQRWPLDGIAGGLQQIEVRCDGADCAFYHQEVLLGRIQDSAFAEGRIGLYLSGKGEAVFNDLRAEGL